MIWIRLASALRSGHGHMPKMASACLAAVVFLFVLAIGSGCKVEELSMYGGDRAASRDGGESSCATAKCENADSQCCNGEPCIDIKSNPLHCGGCGKACPARQACANGNCLCRLGGRDEQCAADAQCCTDGCRQVKSDIKNCGGCGLACKSGESCIDGQCRCGPAAAFCSTGQVCCASGCSDLLSDPKNCGTCGNACPTGKGCQNGQCEGVCLTPCTFPFACCDGVCADLANDPKNCRACGRDCSKVSSFPFPQCVGFICLGEKSDGGTSDM